ncbi:ASCH domain-containing protein [Spirosoma sp. BT702]|uniref:ASCH domain-containing protein n=1 Tax=Spirosoma profusum TaxID=2771354 RepID=A0A927AVW6_9BACT|nr:ASCH domain-containing protein [Spirosoma profusum]MBD2705374.1 ASCH domain-containing protein [Spirosoma profusum]
MTVISLYQPYATLVVLGLKQFETRSWDTHYRGILGIHATSTMPAWCRNLCLQEPFRNRLSAHGFRADNLPLGKILGTVNLVDTQRTEDWLTEKGEDIDNFVNWYEQYLYGDYSDGRFAWEFQNSRLFDVPIPAKGSLGFWKFNLDNE